MIVRSVSVSVQSVHAAVIVASVAEYVKLWSCADAVYTSIDVTPLISLLP